MRRPLYAALTVGTAAILTTAVLATPAAAEPPPSPNNAFVNAAAGTVTFQAGTSRTNRLTVSNVSFNKIKFTELGGVVPGTGCVAGATNKEAICTVGSFSDLTLIINLGSLGDTFNTVGSPLVDDTIIDAGSGNDTIDFGTANGYEAVVYGGLGADTLTAATSSASYLRLYGQGGADVICGGSLTFAQYQGTAAGVNVTMDDVANDGLPGEADNVCSTMRGVTGSAYNDVLVGSAGANSLGGFDGNDSISGLAGNDDVYGDWGNDYLLGGDGDDFVYGSDGVDLQDGGAGTDECPADVDDLPSLNCELS